MCNIAQPISVFHCRIDFTDIRSRQVDISASIWRQQWLKTIHLNHRNQVSSSYAILFTLIGLSQMEQLLLVNAPLTCTVFIYLCRSTSLFLHYFNFYFIDLCYKGEILVVFTFILYGVFTLPETETD